MDNRVDKVRIGVQDGFIVWWGGVGWRLVVGKVEGI